MSFLLKSFIFFVLLQIVTCSDVSTQQGILLKLSIIFKIDRAVIFITGISLLLLLGVGVWMIKKCTSKLRHKKIPDEENPDQKIQDKEHTLKKDSSEESSVDSDSWDGIPQKQVLKKEMKPETSIQVSDLKSDAYKGFTREAEQQNTEVIQKKKKNFWKRLFSKKRRVPKDAKKKISRWKVACLCGGKTVKEADVYSESSESSESSE